MKNFGNDEYRIANSSTEVRLSYTGFLIFAFIGYFTFVLNAVLRIGPYYMDIVVHYRGSDSEEFFPRSFGRMLEEAHYHAFIEGVTLLVLTHLFVATSWSRGAKIAVVTLAFGSALADLAAPWLIKYLAPEFAYMQMTTWVIMLLSAAVMITVPLYEMWFIGKKSN